MSSRLKHPANPTVLPIEDWVKEVGFEKLWREFEVHVEMGAPEDIPRLNMISLRQALREGGWRRAT